MKKCGALNRFGKPCGKDAIPGMDYCQDHYQHPNKILKIIKKFGKYLLTLSLPLILGYLIYPTILDDIFETLISLSERLIKIEEVIITEEEHEELLKKFPLGYIVLELTERKIQIVDTTEFSRNLEFDYRTIKFQFLDESQLKITIPSHIDSEGNFEIADNSVIIPRKEGYIFNATNSYFGNSDIEAYPYNVFIQILRENPSDLIILIGFSKR
ncbi:MAG: hypothetical protein DWP97_05880 [Calditrichaeota bacterium]|nr:MAG: hypothetical protein DWP97_05880 [Calditrichota bacterium]